MGRWYFSSKKEADNLLKLDIYWLKKEGFLRGFKSSVIKWTRGWSGSESHIRIMVSTPWEEGGEDGYAHLQYTQTDRDGGKRDFDYKVRLTTTPCNFGGVRYWFVCPLIVERKHCGRRVGVLYKGGDYFGCRHCYNLTYKSRNENRRYKHYPLFCTLDGYQRIEKLEKQVKRRFYAGKPTRKQRRLKKLYMQLLPHALTALKESKD